MHIRNRVLSVIFKLIVLGFVIYGLAAVLVRDGAPSLRYFTLESNILVGCVTLYLLVEALTARSQGGSPSRLSSYLRGLSMLAISVTGLVYFTMLAPQQNAPIPFDSYALHLVAPVGFVLDWLLFARKGGFRFPHVAVWVIPPLAYLIIMLAVATRTGFYPYPFMDASDIGYGMVAVNAVILLVGFGILGAIYVTVDRLMARWAERRELSRAAGSPLGERQ